MIRTQLIGNLGRGAEVRQINGSFAINFPVAHNKRIVTQDGEVIDQTIWVSCTQWVKQKTDLVKYLQKGTLVHVEGEPDVRTYTTREGKTAVDFRLRVNRVELLSSPKQGSETAPQQQPPSATAEATQADQDDSMPWDD